jgi:hypothetical protein
MGGYSVDEVVGTSFKRYLHPDVSKEAFANYLLRMKDVPVPEVYRSALQHKEGGKLDVQFRARKVLYKGRPADLVFVRKVDSEEETKRPKSPAGGKPKTPPKPPAGKS